MSEDLHLFSHFCICFVRIGCNRSFNWYLWRPGILAFTAGAIMYINDFIQVLLSWAQSLACGLWALTTRSGGTGAVLVGPGLEQLIDHHSAGCLRQ